MLCADFNRTIDKWIDALEQYSFDALCKKPADDRWSIGQVYMHLIENAKFFIEQIKICLSNNDNETLDASPAAKAMFLKNDLPDALIEGPSSNNNTRQPKRIKDLRTSLYQIKNEMNQLHSLVSKSQFKGKTKHPGLSYFNAEEWFQFTEMHFRHHLRQKKRLDDFLKSKP